MGRPKKLDKVQLVYIRDQMDKVSAEDIAGDLGVPAASVARQIDVFRKEGASGTPQPATQGAGNACKRPGALEEFIRAGETSDGSRKGVVVMTAARSMADDAALGVNPFSSVPMTEAQKEYLRTKSRDRTPEELAADTGLPVPAVKEFIDGLDPANASRKEFFERNKEHIHKIRPNESFQ